MCNEPAIILQASVGNTSYSTEQKNSRVLRTDCVLNANFQHVHEL